MVTIILPGYSAHNKTWLEETAEKIGVTGEIRPIYWDHWDDPARKFDKKEKARLIDGVAGKRMVDIIAKSIGTLIASYILQKSPDKIRKIIFNGIPLNDIKEEDKEIIKSALKLISPENIICFQNELDPHGSFEAAKMFLSEVNPEIKIVSKLRSDHEYPYFEEFHNFLLG